MGLNVDYLKGEVNFHINNYINANNYMDLPLGFSNKEIKLEK